ncbi:MAG: ubiquitin-like domain-containing protein [Chloroflexota bacterium]
MTEQLLTSARAAENELVVRLHSGQIVFALLVALIAALSWLYLATERVVAVTVSGQALSFRTHQQTIGALFAENGLRLSETDLVTPPLDTLLAQASDIRIWLAQPVDVVADGRVLRAMTHSGSVADVLDEIGIRLAREDRIWFADDELSVNTLLAQLQPTPLDAQRAREPIQFSVQRALPVHISDDGVASTIYTFAPTVGELLRANDIRIHSNDRISPALQQPISPGLHVLIERSKPLTILADGKTMPAHTREPNIVRALAAAGVRLQGKDYTNPPATGPVLDNMTVQVVRVREVVVEEARAIPFAKTLQADDNLDIDQQRLAQRGQNGEHRKQIRVVYENGQEIKRIVEKEWDARAPTTQITAFGRKLTLRELMTPNGPIQYWRVARMYATSYSPIRSGTSPSKSWFGHTSSGLSAGKGIIAVDKSVVPWLARLYVPGYGIGIAGDTGGNVRGKLIDLGFADDNYESWHDWVDVYWLWPPPDPQTIRWILPNTPTYPDR